MEYKLAEISRRINELHKNSTGLVSNIGYQGDGGEWQYPHGPTTAGVIFKIVQMQQEVINDLWGLVEEHATVLGKLIVKEQTE